VSLTVAERDAGRAFRDSAQADLLATFDTDPPTFTVPNFLALYRHNCPARHLRSTALECKEVYLHSPAYPYWAVPAGRFGFIYRAGTCRHCSATARSRAGRLVDAHARPPMAARVNR
jgi:hypothetical protein